MTTKTWRWCELIVLFVLVPSTLVLPVFPIFLVLLAASAIMYTVIIAKRKKLFNKSSLLAIPRNAPWQHMLLRFAIFTFVSSGLMAIYMPEKLFIVPLQNPAMWLAITFFYSIFSVYPQEFIYRYFFFQRYQELLSSTHLFIALNALVFCIAHLVFDNAFILVLTLVGGILFGLTYRRTQSLMFTSIEHSLYGVWLFTIGAGEILAFPMPK
ncbi:MAG: CPBP family intramembrane metalloprotease [Alteromonadaceae bacterium]|nr:CPBP family intramembrane metalloprotease [Alteromonadaceae bacterium]